MCESNVYMEKDGREELLMEDVARLWPEHEEMVLEGILGQQLRLRARFKWADLEGHRILLEPALSDELEAARRFHGHLGPNVVLGLRMGKTITDRFGSEPFKYSITSYTGRRPPISCIVDGLQLATPCSVGSGTIQIAEGGQARVVAQKEGRHLEIRVRQQILDRMEAEYGPQHEEELPRELWTLPDEELFETAEDQGI